jgi:transposase
LRYPSDLTDDEWRLVEPLIPPGVDPASPLSPLTPKETSKPTV